MINIGSECLSETEAGMIGRADRVAALQSHTNVEGTCRKACYFLSEVVEFTTEWLTPEGERYGNDHAIPLSSDALE